MSVPVYRLYHHFPYKRHTSALQAVDPETAGTTGMPVPNRTGGIEKAVDLYAVTVPVYRWVVLLALIGWAGL